MILNRFINFMNRTLNLHSHAMVYAKFASVLLAILYVFNFEAIAVRWNGTKGSIHAERGILAKGGPHGHCIITFEKDSAGRINPHVDDYAWYYDRGRSNQGDTANNKGRQGSEHAFNYDKLVYIFSKGTSRNPNWNPRSYGADLSRPYLDIHVDTEYTESLFNKIGAQAKADIDYIKGNSSRYLLATSDLLTSSYCKYYKIYYKNSQFNVEVLTLEQFKNLGAIANSNENRARYGVVAKNGTNKNSIISFRKLPSGKYHMFVDDNALFYDHNALNKRLYSTPSYSTAVSIFEWKSSDIKVHTDLHGRNLLNIGDFTHYHWKNSSMSKRITAMVGNPNIFMVTKSNDKYYKVNYADNKFNVEVITLYQFNKLTEMTAAKDLIMKFNNQSYRIAYNTSAPGTFRATKVKPITVTNTLKHRITLSPTRLPNVYLYKNQKNTIVAVDKTLKISTPRAKFRIHPSHWNKIQSITVMPGYGSHDSCSIKITTDDGTFYSLGAPTGTGTKYIIKQLPYENDYMSTKPLKGATGDWFRSHGSFPSPLQRHSYAADSDFTIIENLSGKPLFQKKNDSSFPSRIEKKSVIAVKNNDYKTLRFRTYIGNNPNVYIIPSNGFMKKVYRIQYYDSHGKDAFVFITEAFKVNGEIKYGFSYNYNGAGKDDLVEVDAVKEEFTYRQNAINYPGIKYILDLHPSTIDEPSDINLDNTSTDDIYKE